MEAQIFLTYMNMTQSVTGLKCPKCGEAYLTEDVVKSITEGEQQLESK